MQVEAPASFASSQTMISDALPGTAGYYPQGALTVTPVGAINCAINGTTLSCTANGIYTLAAGTSFSVTFPVTPTAAGGRLPIPRLLIPDGVMPESDENNNTALDTVAVQGADLSINKTDGQTSYLPGSVVIYTVTVTNFIGVTANAATVSDAKPANVSTWAWACASQTGNATGRNAAADSASDFTDTVNLPVGGTIVYTVTANTLAGVTTDLVNTATVSVPTGFSDPNPNNNTSTDSDGATTQQADLSLTKDDGQTGYLAGGTVTYTVTVTNLSGVDVTGAVVSRPKTGQYLHLGLGVYKPDRECSWVYCDGQLVVRLHRHGQFACWWNDRLHCDRQCVSQRNRRSGRYFDRVNAPTGIGDSDLSNNTSTDTDVASVVDLSGTKDDGQVTFAAGAVVTYTVTITNKGGTTATGATISDPKKPANISTWAWACTTQSGGASGCDPAADSSNNFTDTINLPVNGTIVYTVTANVVAAPTGNLVNTVTVDPPAGTTDSRPIQQRHPRTRILLHAADLSLTKTSSTSSVRVGDHLTFTLTLKYAGPDTAYNVEVTDKGTEWLHICVVRSKQGYI